MASAYLLSGWQRLTLQTQSPTLPETAPETLSAHSTSTGASHHCLQGLRWPRCCLWTSKVPRQGNRQNSYSLFPMLVPDKGLVLGPDLELWRVVGLWLLSTEPMACRNSSSTAHPIWTHDVWYFHVFSTGQTLKTRCSAIISQGAIIVPWGWISSKQVTLSETEKNHRKFQFCPSFTPAQSLNKWWWRDKYPHPSSQALLGDLKGWSIYSEWRTFSGYENTTALSIHIAKDSLSIQLSQLWSSFISYLARLAALLTFFL